MTNKRTGNCNRNSNGNRNDNCNGKDEIQGSVRLRCSQSAVSNFAQDDVRFGSCGGRQLQRQPQPRFLPLLEGCGGQQPFFESAAALRAATQPGLVTWRLRPKANAPSGTSSVMQLPAAT
jgi:hypothetical protein